MSLAGLLPTLERQTNFAELAGQLRADATARLTLSIADAAQPYALAALHASLDRAMLVLVARPSQARELRDELACWHPDPDAVMLFPEQDALPYEPLAPDPQATGDRLAVLTRLLESEPGATPPLVVACGRAAADLLAPPEQFRLGAFRLRIGDRIRPDELLRRWLDLGYEAAQVVDTPGQFGRRGGIVDIYPLVGNPVRIEFFGDEIDSLRAFDPLTQRSTGPIDQVLVPPAGERGAADTSSTLQNYLPSDGLLVLVERASVAATAHEFERQVAGLRDDLIARGELAPEAPIPFVPWDHLAEQLEARVGRQLELDHDPDAETVTFVQAPAFAGRLRHLLAECRRRTAAGERTAIVTQQAQRLAELFEEAGLPTTIEDNEQPGTHHGVLLVPGQLQEGWAASALGLAVFTDSEIFGWHKVRRQSRPRRPAGRQTLLTELTPGELVVHVEHGIGRYRGMVTLGGDGQATSSDGQREFLLLEYAGGDNLYVPADQADRVNRYIGAGDAGPTITRLGSGEWNRARNRVRRAVREIARDLLELYARREHAAGFAFPPDTVWQRELESSFAFVETPDQLRALAEVKLDMESSRPMDRLLVGDVGYGKTEIALRAAFKAAESGKQIAMLVPTTVLAQQHWKTFRDRLAAFPVKVEMLSRFRSDAEQREVTRGLADGSVDICIGTHRLLQKDVRFKDVGLVIVDEEQRFGVANKERLKQLRSEVDVLTLTATPIPRTLHMSLIGVRDMSTIETPPDERLPIRTYVTEYDQGLVREAILRELDRGGQVFYVHNRVQSIAAETARLTRLVPEARFAIGHGQMPEEQLEQVMLDFADGRYDVLVCTTIIESGLDIPAANTLIVNSADRFGLAQLYQLRGRVGRAAARAYAYFLYTKDTSLTEIAEKRLRTIFEATELGAGFKIALKDLEIRGAGNLLGSEQHGHISAVGFDLYTRLLAEAVSQLKEARASAEGEPGARASERTEGALVLPPAASLQPGPSISLPVAAYLPADYVADDSTRLGFYQRLAAVVRGSELGELVAELIDRFGPLPEPAQNLVFVLSLRLAARDAGVQQIQNGDGEIVVRFVQLPRLDVSRLARQVGAPLRAGSNQLRLPRGRGQGWMVQLQTLIEALPASA
jgi:transcription-repair coupling factor (superfamily II helicase)